MSWITDARDTVENVGSIATAPFTFGQSERLVSKSGQDSGLGHFAQFMNDVSKYVDIAGLVAGGAYLAAPVIVGAVEAAGPGATTTLAADAAAPTAAEALPEALVQGGAAAPADAAWGANTIAEGGAAGVAGPTPAASIADTATYGLAPGSSIDPATGSVLTPGPGGAGALDPGTSGALTGASDWVEKHPITSLIGANVGGGLISGYANRQAALETAKKQHEYAMEQADLPRVRKQGNASVGGAGVNLNVRPSGKLLKRPDGSTVFVPNTGIINGAAMNGVRG